jgi:hypothetical protein
MYKVYYTDPHTDQAYSWSTTSLTDALSLTKKFRDAGMTFVTMVSEDPNSVGKPGVDSIKDGLCPDGVAYTWTKRR